MGATEIVLLVLGIVIFVLSFVIPAKREKLSKESIKEAKEEIQKIVDEAVKEANSNIEDNVSEISDYNVEKAERAMERLCNEKIMSINEYSSTVLESIDKNQQQVVFMYDMLNEKHTALKEVVAEADKIAKEAKQTAMDVALEIKEAKEVKPKSTRKTKAVQQEKEELESVEVKEVSAFKEDAPANPEMIDFLSEDSVSNGETEKDDDVVKQFSDIKTSKSKKSSPKKKTAKVKEGEAPDLNIGSLGVRKEGGNSNERILKLHAEGKSNVAIAKELGLGIGEVKLVIDLFEGM